MADRFRSKVVLVTGGDRNTGLWLVRKFADEGAKVFTCAPSGDCASEGVAALAKMGVSGVTMAVCDISSQSEVDALFGRIERECGRLDVLVNNAADQGLGHGGILDMSPEALRTVLGVNVVGGFMVTQAAARLFARNAGARKGAVVFLSSNTAQRAIRGRVAYCASKGAINSMVRALALDLAPLGIRVNACAPGYINTTRWDTLDPKIAARRRTNCPLGREAKGADIANVVAFLASDEADNITGEIVTCDAGCSCQHMPSDVDV